MTKAFTSKKKAAGLCYSTTTFMYFLYVFSCDVLGVLEKEKCQPSSSLGLHGLSRGRRKAKAGLCCQGTLPGKKSHHWSQGTQFSCRRKAQTYRRRLRNHSFNGIKYKIMVTVFEISKKKVSFYNIPIFSLYCFFFVLLQFFFLVFLRKQKIR